MNCTDWNCSTVSSDVISDIYYEPFIKTLNTVIAALLIIFMPIIILVNSLVILSVVVFWRLRRHTNYLLCSLAFADLLVGTVTFPLYILFYMGPESLHYNRTACLVWFGSAILGCGGSLYNLLLLVVDRFIAIAYPFFHLKLKSSKSVYLIGFPALWIYIIVLSALPLLGWNNLGENTHCIFYSTLPKAYVFWALYGTVGVCIIVSSILYVKIFYIIRKHNNLIHPLSEIKEAIRYKVNLHTLYKHGKDTKGTKFNTVIFLMFIIFWTPFFIMIPIKYSSLPYKYVETAKNLTLLLAFVNSMVNPVAYIYIRHDFRTAFKLLLRTSLWHWSDLAWHTLDHVITSGFLSYRKGEFRPEKRSRTHLNLAHGHIGYAKRSACTNVDMESNVTIPTLTSTDFTMPTLSEDA